jgi:hypothetical protein
MAQSDDSATRLMFTTEQVRAMLPEGAADTAHAIGTRCRRAGAYFMWGWPVAEIRQVLERERVTPVVAGTEPLPVYTLEDVISMVHVLGWAQTDTAVRWHLQGTKARARRGYSPADAVLEAMERPGGKDWRKGMTTKDATAPEA